jgi:hypothetical protein
MFFLHAFAAAGLGPTVEFFAESFIFGWFWHWKLN